MCVCLQMFSYMCVYVYVYVCVCMCICVCVCVCACIYACVANHLWGFRREQRAPFIHTDILSTVNKSVTEGQQ
jgi:hypothetical protein